MDYTLHVMGKLLSVREAALALGLSEKTVRAWLAAGRLAYVKLGRRTLVPENSILDAIARGFHRPSN